MEQLSKISDILIESVVNKKTYSSSIKRATAFGFWNNIAGAKFSSFSMPYDIKGKTLFVGVKNPQVMQELIFYKDVLLKKINDYFLPLDIAIEEIRYDYKVWNKLNAKEQIPYDDTLSYYSEDEIQEVYLTKQEKEELEKVADTISNLSCLNDKLKEKYAQNIINAIKVKKLRKS